MKVMSHSKHLAALAPQNGGKTASTDMM